MPYTKIEDAPANVRSLDGAPLTLEQINKIMEMYDAMKGNPDLESPMGAAINNWKRGHEIRGGKWMPKEVK